MIRELLMYHLYDVPNLKARRVDLMYLNSNPVRLIGRHCISTRDQAKKHQRYRCVQHTTLGIRKNAIYQCRKCDVTLCIFPCFEIFHTNKGFPKALFKLTLLFEKSLSHLKEIVNIWIFLVHIKELVIEY